MVLEIFYLYVDELIVRIYEVNAIVRLYWVTKSNRLGLKSILVKDRMPSGKKRVIADGVAPSFRSEEVI